MVLKKVVHHVMNSWNAVFKEKKFKSEKLKIQKSETRYNFKTNPQKLYSFFKICDAKKEEFIVQNKVTMKKISEDSEETYKTPQVLIDQLLELYFTGKLDEKIIGDQVETIVVLKLNILVVSFITPFWSPIIPYRSQAMRPLLYH